MGLFAAVAPSFLAAIIGVDNHAAAGLIASSTFIASALAQVAATRLPARRALALGCATLVIGMLALTVALLTTSLIGLISAAVISGIGQGISFSRGLAAVTQLSPPDQRAEVSSTLFVVAYLAISLPVIGEGLAAHRWGLSNAGIAFAITVGALAIACLTAILILDRRSQPAGAPH
jgi:dipeptide/tripeptide permease